MEFDIGKWVRQAREKAQLSQEQLALDLGYKGKGTVSAWEKNTNAIPFHMMLEISKRTGEPLPYLRESDSPVITTYKDPADGPIKLHLYDIAASCGNGHFNSNYPDLLRAISFTPDAALELFGTSNLKNVALVPPDGDSMHPTIPQRSIAFMKTDITEFSSSGIYYFNFQGADYIKRLFISKGNVIKVSSDNEFYRTGDFDILPEEQDQLHIYGKLWKVMPIEILDL